MKFPFSNPKYKDILVAGGFLMVCMLLIFASMWAYHQFITTPPYVDPIKYPVRGIDVSSHNGNIDFKKVAAAGIEFVFIKATEGANFKDKNFRINYLNAKAAGLKTGVYHFFRFDRDGVEQAINLLTTIGSRTPELGMVIDVEKSGNPDSIPTELINRRLIEMVDYLNLLGHRVMFYTNLDGYYDYLADSFPGYPLWICRFQANPINAEWTFWQFSHRGRINGIKGDVDMNAFCGNHLEWESYLQGNLWPYTNNGTPSKQ
ncbi:MAG: lysozyme [Bacteroides sp.]|nr:lysozyme [Bacteroides sp.]